MIKVGVVGATGYAGEEVIKILSKHKGVTITALQAVIDKEAIFSDMFPYFEGKVDILCKKPDPAGMAKEVDLVFLGLPHKVSMDVVPPFVRAGKTVIDLSADYRLTPELYAKWYGVEHRDRTNLPAAVYGMPELYREKIKTAKLIANPGCYPTSVILGMAPALAGKAVRTDYLIADAKSGASGAGRKAHLSLSFCEINENLKAYKVNEHQHKPEISMILSHVAGAAIDVIFTPHLIPMNRGILSTIYMKLTKPMDTQAAVALYREFYKGKPFVRVADAGKLPQIRDIVATNYCDIGLKVTGDTLIVVSCIDSLTKGVAGQAVQNMNIICGFDETEGLV